MKTLDLLGISAHVISVDLASKLYYDSSLECGYVYKNYEEEFDIKCTHDFLLGSPVASHMEKIGKEIDFVIIDTVHFLPGEVLDFLAVYPYLSKNAIVVLHDTNLDFIRAKNTSDAFHNSAYKATATKFLFTTISADKYTNIDWNDELPNISAFAVNKDTDKYIQDIFFGLSLTWGYMPSKELLNEYRSCYERNYDTSCLKAFDKAVEMNQIMVKNLPTHEW